MAAGKGVSVFGPTRRMIHRNITVFSDRKIQFRDTGVYIYSNADGKITISADGTGSDDIILDGAVTVNDSLTVLGNLTFADAITDILTVSGLVKIGTNAAPLVLTAGTPTFTLYTTNAGASGSTNAEPFYMKSVLTGAGQVGGRAYFLVTSNVASGSWINAIKGDIEFGASGSTSGLASAICAEMTAPNQSVPSGQYYPLEVEMVFGSSTGVDGNLGSGAGFIYMNITGTTTDFDDEAGLFWMDGVAAGAGHILSANNNTIRCFVTSSMTARYLVTSSAEDTITLSRTLTSQSTDSSSASLTLSTDSTYLGGTNLTYSGGITSSVLKLTGTHSAVTGGLHGVYATITASNNYTTDGHGIIVYKGVVTSTDTAVTDGELMGAQFISKKAGTGTAANAASWIGVEGWFYETGSGVVGTGIGGNFGWHADSSAGSHPAGTVWRGVQIFCDNSGTSDATETTGLCIWNVAGTVDAAIRITESGSGFTVFADMTDCDQAAFITSGGTDCTASGATDPSYTMKVTTPDGAAGYIRVWAAA